MTVLLNTFSDSSENPFCEVPVKRLTEKFRKMGKLARTPKFNMELVCPRPIHSHENDQSLELSIHQRPIAHSQTMAFCLLHSLDVQIGYPNRVSTTQVDVSGHVLTTGNTVGDNIY